VLTKTTLQGDPVLSILLAGQVLGAEVLERVQAEHPPARTSHGFVFQVLLRGPAAIGELAEVLGVTSQAVSQSVAELERLGYVERRRSAADGRRREVALTAAGQDVVEAGRAARAAISKELAGVLGEDRTRALAAALADVLEARGAMDTIRARRVRPVA
jgi:DNA-binding MarR family transcriptional regulator